MRTSTILSIVSVTENRDDIYSQFRFWKYMLPAKWISSRNIRAES